MAKYYVTYKCEHEGTVDIFGTNVNGEREKKAEWYKTCLCPDCYKKAQEAEQQAKMTEGNMVEKEISYKEYKTNPEYNKCETKKNSYNASTKTIIVYVKA